jgi:hypothetical protein
MATSWWIRALVGVLAAGGITLGHSLAYTLTFSDPHARAESLVATGHGYWPFGGALLVALAVATIGVALSRRFRSAFHSKPAGLAASTGVLVVLQVGGFALLEAGERFLFATHDHGSLLTQPVFWAGVAIQFVAASINALLMQAIRRVVRAVSRLLRESGRPDAARHPSVVCTVRAGFAPAAAPGATSFSLRGPPRSS